MTLGSRDYVPVLKLKRGEKAALRALAGAVAHRVTPLLEMVERRDARSLEAHLENAFLLLSESLVGYPRWFLDLRELEPDGEEAARRIFERALAEGMIFTPVTGVMRTADVAAALAHRKNGLALRLTRSEFERGGLRAHIVGFLARHQVQPEEIDLIVDLGAVADLVAEGVAALSAAFLAEVPDHPRWRTLTLSASAFPVSMKKVSRNSHEFVERSEWISWRESLYRQRMAIARLPTFSDCCIQHPLGVEGFDPAKMTASAAIRYAWQDSWLLIKGESTRAKPPSRQFPALAAQLARGRHSTEFYGSEHCEGCRSIQASACGARGLGSPEAWRRIGTIHHITTVVHQIDALPWP